MTHLPAQSGRNGRKVADDNVISSVLRVRADGTVLQSGRYSTRSNVDERCDQIFTQKSITI